MRGLILGLYLCSVAGTGEAALLPCASGRPCLIHCNVLATGRDPTCTYTPSSGGEKLRNGFVRSPSEPDGKSTTIWSPCTPLTGYGPTPSPAAVRALASETEASCSLVKVCCSLLFGSQALYDPGEYTLRPSVKFNETPERFSLISSAAHPKRERMIAISLARFCASASPGTVWIKTFVPANRSNPANHFFAGGSSSMPINPAFLGKRTVCNERLSAVSRAVSFFSRSEDSFARAASDLVSDICLSASFWTKSVSSYPTYPAMNAVTAAMPPEIPAIHKAALTTNSQVERGDPHSIVYIPVWPILAAAGFVIVVLAGLFVLARQRLSRLHKQLRRWEN